MLLLAAELYGFIKYQVPKQQMGPFFYRWARRGTPTPSAQDNSTIMAPSEERRPGHSEQYTLCNCLNGDQTERTNHAHESCMWTWTTTRIESTCRNLSSPLKWSLFLTSSWEKSISLYPELKIALLLHGLQYCGLLKLRLKLNTIS